MSVLDLLRKPRIVEAVLLHAPFALPDGRTAVKLRIEGAGVLSIGRARKRFWRGFDGVVLAPVSLSVIVKVTSLVGSDTRELKPLPLPGAPLPLPAPVPTFPTRPATPRVVVPSLAITAFPRGSTP